MKDFLNVAVACGGTGGHVFPGLATARELLRRGHEVSLWITGRDTEQHALEDWPGDVVVVPAEGFPSGFSVKSLQRGVKLLRAVIRCARIMKKKRPDVLLAMGSYASAGPCGAAILRRIPLVLHEANVVPGRAVRFFSRGAAAVAAAFEETRYYLQGTELVVTGMPLREDIAAAAVLSRKEPAPGQPLRLLIMGGSLGAHRLNEIVSEALCWMHQGGALFRAVHLSGKADEEMLNARYQAAGVPVTVHAFMSDMVALYRDTDLAICRAGAATCAELNVFAVPALFIPYPFAAKDHQMANARALEKRGVGDVVPEQDTTPAWLQSYILECIRAPERLAQKRENVRVRGIRNGTVALAGLVERMAAGG